MNFVKRIVAFAIWVTAIGITMLLVDEFTAGSGQVVLGVSALAIAASSLGLIFARFEFAAKNYISCAFGLVMWIAGVWLLATTEIGYWSARVNAQAAKHDVETLASKGRSKVIEQAQTQLSSFETARSPKIVAAEMKALLAKPMTRAGETLGDLTASCTEVPDNLTRDCSAYKLLDVELARGEAAASLKQMVWDTGTVLQPNKSSLDVTAAAGWFRNKFGGELENWRDTLMLSAVLLLMLCRDGALFIAFAPKKQPLAVEVARLPTVYATPAPIPVASTPQRTAIAAPTPIQEMAEEPEAAKIADVEPKRVQVEKASTLEEPISITEAQDNVAFFPQGPCKNARANVEDKRLDLKNPLEVARFVTDKLEDAVYDFAEVRAAMERACVQSGWTKKKGAHSFIGRVVASQCMKELGFTTTRDGKTVTWRDGKEVRNPTQLIVNRSGHAMHHAIVSAQFAGTAGRASGKTSALPAPRRVDYTRAFA